MLRKRFGFLGFRVSPPSCLVSACTCRSTTSCTPSPASGTPFVETPGGLSAFRLEMKRGKGLVSFQQKNPWSARTCLIPKHFVSLQTSQSSWKKKPRNCFAPVMPLASLQSCQRPPCQRKSRLRAFTYWYLAMTGRNPPPSQVPRGSRCLHARSCKYIYIYASICKVPWH